MSTETCAESTLDREKPAAAGRNSVKLATAEPALEFGRFRVLVRQRKLVADGRLIDLGSRAPSIFSWSCWSRRIAGD